MTAGSAPAGFVTARQMEILRLRRDGLSRQEIADRLGTSRQNVAVLEARARQNISRAEATMAALISSGLALRVAIPAETHMLEAAKAVLDAADRARIHMKDDVVSMLALLRAGVRGYVEDGRLNREVHVTVFPGGEILVGASGQGQGDQYRDHD